MGGAGSRRSVVKINLAKISYDTDNCIRVSTTNAEPGRILAI